MKTFAQILMVFPGIIGFPPGRIDPTLYKKTAQVLSWGHNHGSLKTQHLSIWQLSFKWSLPLTYPLGSNKIRENTRLSPQLSSIICTFPPSFGVNTCRSRVAPGFLFSVLTKRVDNKNEFQKMRSKADPWMSSGIGTTPPHTHTGWQSPTGLWTILSRGNLNLDLPF